jgi:hypothetical protein
MAFARDLPTANADGSVVATPSRTGTYAEAYANVITNKELFTADEGSYFTAISPTPGTGIIGHAAPTTFDETKPYLTLFNGGTKRIYPQFLRLYETVASVGGARVQFTVCTDTGNRRSSAGTAMTVSKARLGASASSLATVFQGAVVASAATGARVIHDHIVFRGTIDIIEDCYEIVFGGLGGGNMTASRVATVADASRTASPIVVEPGNTFLIHQWAGAQSTGPTWIATLGYIER